MLLAIDEARLTAEVPYEAPTTLADETVDERFPRFYGPLNLDAVSAIEPLIPDGDGNFTFDASVT